MAISRRDFLAGAAGAGILAADGSGLAEPPQSSAAATPSPYLSGNFAPVREEIAAEGLKVIGQLPAELNGMFVRNGPNPQFPPKRNYHWFDGDGMLHGVRIQDGKASYRNRWIRTKAWVEAHQAGRALYPSVLDPPDFKLFMQQLLKGETPYPNTANTALVWHHGKLLALWEGGPPHEIKPASLETVGAYTFGKSLKHAFTAHPKVDPRTGELITFGYSPIPPYVQCSVASPDGTITSTTPIALPRPVMMHDMAITANYSLFIDCPMVFDPAAIVRGKPFIRYEPQHGSQIGVLPRHAAGDKIRWFPIKTCFIFHVFNAYEEGDEVALSACRYPKYPDFVDFDTSAKAAADGGPQALDGAKPVAYHWRLNLKTGSVSESPLDDQSSEFPRVNEQFTGARTRFGYTVGSEWSGLFKYDFDRGTREQHSLGKGLTTGEGVFVPRPGGKSEDDGWLLSFTHDLADGGSELRVIDCRDLTDAPVARIQIPQRVPYGFHAVWLPDGAL